MFAAFFILFFVSGCCLVVGLIKPALVLRWGSKRTRLRAAGWYFLFTAIFFFLTAGTAPKAPPQSQVATPPAGQAPTAMSQSELKQPTSDIQQNQTTQDSNNKQQSDEEIIKDVERKNSDIAHKQSEAKQEINYTNNTTTVVKEFNFNIKSFIERYNVSAKKFGEATVRILKSTDKDDKSGKVYLLESKNKYIGFTVTTNNSGLVTDSIMIGAGDGTPSSGASVILSMASYFDVFEPGIGKEGRKAILKGLGILSGELPDNVTYTRNNVTYKLINTKVAGVWLVAEPAK